MKKNILVIAYFFPPLGGSGVQRTLKYVKYLNKFGYTPIVATVENGHNFSHDYNMLKEIPEEVRIYRSNSGEKLWLRKIIEKTENTLKKLRSNKPKELNVTNVPSEVNDIETKQNIKEKLFRYLEYNIYIPDSKIRWYKHAVKSIKNKVLKENEINMIYSTSYPYTDHLIGLEIKKTTGLKWVADFRDPWVGNEFIYDRYDNKRKEKEKNLEREVVKYADLIINVTEQYTEMYKKRYSEYAEKFVTITNGFDKMDLEDTTEIEEEKFVIRYTGMLTNGFSIKPLISALEELSEEDNQFSEDLKFEFTGLVIEEQLNIIKKSKIIDKININGYVEHKKAVELMKSANINLVILPNNENSKNIYTGKIFDCMLVQKPILGIMPTEGIAAEAINENDIGKAFEYNDINGIKEYIKDVYSKHKLGVSINTNAIEKCYQFDREYLTAKLAKYFDELMDGRGK